MAKCRTFWNSNKSKLDVHFIHQFLSSSYWAKGRTLDEIKSSIENSLCFGIYHHKKQIGFARIVTDKTIFSYLMDFFIDEKHQGKKYGQLFFTEIYKHSDLVNVKNHYLHTKDAQKFYEKFGFKIYPTPNKQMIKSQND